MISRSIVYIRVAVKSNQKWEKEEDDKYEQAEKIIRKHPPGAGYK